MEFIVITDSSHLDFQEVAYADSPFALISGVVLSLNQASQGKKHHVYRFSEGVQLADSLVGKNVFEGVDFFGRHKTSIHDKVGVVKRTLIKGDKIIAFILIRAKKLIKAIASGKRFWFSIMGNAKSETPIKTASGETIRILNDAKISSLQILKEGVKVGFPEAQLSDVLKIQETVMLISPKEIAEIGTVQLLSDPEINKTIFEELIKL